MKKNVAVCAHNQLHSFNCVLKHESFSFVGLSAAKLLKALLTDTDMSFQINFKSFFFSQTQKGTALNSAIKRLPKNLSRRHLR